MCECQQCQTSAMALTDSASHPPLLGGGTGTVAPESGDDLDLPPAPPYSPASSEGDDLAIAVCAALDINDWKQARALIAAASPAVVRRARQAARQLAHDDADDDAAHKAAAILFGGQQ